MHDDLSAVFPHKAPVCSFTLPDIFFQLFTKMKNLDQPLWKNRNKFAETGHTENFQSKFVSLPVQVST